MPTHEIFVKSDGTVCGVSCVVTQKLGLPTKRASHVEPVNRLLRCVFHFIRKRTQDDSRLAAFTRRWPVRWRVRIFGPNGGTTLGPFNDRQEAIDAEVAWINKQLGLK